MIKRATGLCFIKNLKDMQQVERLVWGEGGSFPIYCKCHHIGQSFDRIDVSQQDTG